MNMNLKKSITTIAGLVAVATPTAAAIAPSASALTASTTYVASGVTLPSKSNITAQFKTTGVASKKTATTTSKGDTITDTTTTTTIKYTNGDVQTIASTVEKGSILDHPNKLVHHIENKISFPNGASVYAYTDDLEGENYYFSTIDYIAHTKSAANVRDDSSTDSTILTVVPAGATIKVTVSTNDVAAHWSRVSNPQIDKALAKSANPMTGAHMADSTFAITPLS